MPLAADVALRRFRTAQVVSLAVKVAAIVGLLAFLAAYYGAR